MCILSVAKAQIADHHGVYHHGVIAPIYVNSTVEK